jgi:Methyltransferase domain
MTPEESIAWKPTFPGGSTDILVAMRDILLPRVPSGGVYVEVGCMWGRSLSFVGLERPDLKLVAVDPWDNEWDDAGERLPVGPDRERRDKYGGMYEGFLATMTEHAPTLVADMLAYDLRSIDSSVAPMAQPLPTRLTVLRGKSKGALTAIPDHSVDLAFLDGDHTYDGLKADIEEGLRIVRPGGVLAGHDFTQVSWGGAVQAAVRDMLLFRVRAKGFDLAPWPAEREGWEHGYSSVWIAKGL